MNIALMLILVTVAAALAVPLVLGIWRVSIRSVVPPPLVPAVERVQNRARPFLVGFGFAAGRIANVMVSLARDGLVGVGAAARRGLSSAARAAMILSASAVVGASVVLSAAWAVFIALLIALVSVIELMVRQATVIGFRSGIRIFTTAGRMRNSLSAAGARLALGGRRVGRKLSLGTSSLASSGRRAGRNLSVGTAGLASGGRRVGRNLSVATSSLASGTGRLGARFRNARERLSEARWSVETASLPRTVVTEELPDKKIASSRLLVAVLISASAFAVLVILAFRWVGAAIRSIVS